MFFKVFAVVSDVVGMTMDIFGNSTFGGTATGSKLAVKDGAGGNQFELSRGTGRALFGQEANVDGLILYVGDSGTEVLTQRWHTSGNTSIGSSADNGYKFEVAGTAKVTGKITTDNDIEITDYTKGILMKSPDGTRYRITVANGGTLTVTSAP